MTAVSTARMPFSMAAMTRACAAWAMRPTHFGCSAIPSRLCRGAGRPSRWPVSWVIPPAWPIRSISVAVLHQYRRDVTETLELAEELQGLAADQGLLIHLAAASVLRGWALVERGRSEEGMAQIRQGFATGEPTRVHLRAHSLALLAEAWGKEGNFTEGLAVLAKAFTLVEETGIRILRAGNAPTQGGVPAGP